MIKKPKINLYIEYYTSNNLKRQKEINNTLEHNLSLDFIDQILIFVNKKDYNDCLNLIKTKSKIIFNIIQERTTFQDVFDISNKTTSKNDINITCNNDIFLTNSFMNLSLLENEFYCLSRFEDYDSQYPVHFQTGSSQDIWVWKGKNKIIDANFYYGLYGCDNKLAYLANKHGYYVKNPCYTYRAIHNHKSHYKVLKNKDQKNPVLLPWLFVKPTF